MEIEMEDQRDDPHTTSSRPSWRAAGVALAAVAASALVIGLFYLAASGRVGHEAGLSLERQEPSPTLPAGGSGLVNVQVGDLWVETSTATVRPGPTTFRVENVGATTHDLMIERVPIKMERPGVPMEMAAEGGVESLMPGMTKRMRVRLRPGRYELFCSVPSHFQGGQHGEIAVTGDGRA